MVIKTWSTVMIEILTCASQELVECHYQLWNEANVTSIRLKALTEAQKL